MKNIILYFGSFNPIHRGHIALSEYVVEKGLCEQVVLMVSPQNPLKRSDVLAPELQRFEMAEIACRASAFPDRIVPSAVEFLLPRPSYTIDTLRYLQQNHGSERRFSLLMGADQMENLHYWKEFRTILQDYRVLVYPRQGAEPGRYLDQVVYLQDAPLFDYTSTDVRETLQRGGDVTDKITPEVLQYIREKGLWTPEAYYADLAARIAREPDNTSLYVERGKWHYRRNEWGNALNDFNRALSADASCAEAQQYVEMVQEILQYRYTDIYNP